MRVSMYPGRVRDDDNPFVTILAAALANSSVDVSDFNPFVPSRCADVFHVHWLEGVFWGRLARLSSRIAVRKAKNVIRFAKSVRRRGGAVVWTVHNLAPHSNLRGTDRTTWAMMIEQFLPLVTDVIVMSQGAIESVKRVYPTLGSVEYHNIPHPHYREFFAKFGHTPDLRSKIDADSSTVVLACIGKIRPYKQIVETIETLRAVADLDFRMIIAGSGDGDYIQKIRALVDGDSRFLLDFKNLSHQEVMSYLSAANVALFNFREILNSGSVLTALSLNTPVIAPRLGALVELENQVGSQSLRLYDRPMTESWLAECLSSLVTSAASIDLDALAPAKVASQHISVYRRLSGRA